MIREKAFFLLISIVLFLSACGRFPAQSSGGHASHNSAKPSGTAPLGTSAASSSLSASTTGETPIANFNNVYSPSLILQGGTLVMYFGGWVEASQAHDHIYRAECQGPMGPCQAPVKVIDSVALGFQHLNDPSVIQLPSGQYLMYMTGVAITGNGLVATDNHVYVSSSSDGIHWSSLALIAADIWMPSATLNAANEVLLFGTTTAFGETVVYNLGPSGGSIRSRSAVSRTVANTLEMRRRSPPAFT